MPSIRDRLPARGFVVAGHIAVFAVFCCYAFSRNLKELFLGLDGTFMLTVAAHQFAWLPPAAGYFASPFQGLGDLWFPVNVWLLPGFILPHLAWGSGSEMSESFRIAAYVVISLELFTAVLVLARALGSGWLPSLLAAWLTPLLLMPLFRASLMYPIAQLVPQSVTAISEISLAVAAIALLGKKWSGPSKVGPRDLVLTLSIFALAAHLTLALPNVTVLCVPLVGFAIAGCVAGSETKRETLVRLGGLGTVALVLAAGGFAAFLLGIFLHSAPYFWSSQFENDRISWYYVSILFHKAGFGWAGPLLALAGLAGLVHAAVRGHRRERRFATAILSLVLVLAVASTATVFLDFWHGPSPLYFEFFLWPFYAIYAARGAVVAAVWLASRAGKSNGRLEAILERPSTLAWLLPLILAVPLAGIARLGPAGARTAFPLPPTESRIVSFLREHIALEPGKLFQGRVATMEAMKIDEPVGWLKLHGEYHAPRAEKAGNDHHLAGLWHFDIPTLIEYNANTSPAFFRAVTRLLARPADRQMRSTLVLRRADARLLAFFGVRYLISDAPQHPPFRSVITETLSGGEVLYLYEIPEPNVGNVAPIEVSSSESFEKALDQIALDRFDFKRSAVSIGMPAGLPKFQTELKPVESSELRIEGGGVLVKAKSAGTSLLVIPFEFSHCLIVRSRDQTLPPPRLYRMDALLVGVLFDKVTDAEIQYFTGPFAGATCRIQDERAFKRFVTSGKD